MKKSVENLVKRKASGGRRKASRGRRKYETDRYSAEPVVGANKVVVRHTRGYNLKFATKAVEFANVVDPASRKISKAKITRVTKNPSNKDYQRRGVITRGAIIETEAGTAKVLSRPGQDGVVNAVLVK